MEERSTPLTVLLADPDERMRSELRRILEDDEGEPRFLVIGEQTEGLVEGAERLRPDLIILDPYNDRGPGFEVIDQLYRRIPEVRRVIVTRNSERHDLIDLLQMRVHAYLLGDTEIDLDMLLATLRLVGRTGAACFDPRVIEDDTSS